MMHGWWTNKNVTEVKRKKKMKTTIDTGAIQYEQTAWRYQTVNFYEQSVDWIMHHLRSRVLNNHLFICPDPWQEVEGQRPGLLAEPGTLFEADAEKRCKSRT